MPVLTAYQDNTYQGNIIDASCPKTSNWISTNQFKYIFQEREGGRPILDLESSPNILDERFFKLSKIKNKSLQFHYFIFFTHEQALIKKKTLVHLHLRVESIKKERKAGTNRQKSQLSNSGGFRVDTYLLLRRCLAFSFYPKLSWVLTTVSFSVLSLLFNNLRLDSHASATICGPKGRTLFFPELGVLNRFELNSSPYY